MTDTIFLYCPNCQKRYALNESRWRCDCGNYLNLSPITGVKRELLPHEPGLKRYMPLWPFLHSPLVSLGEERTPLRLAQFGDKTVYCKMDYTLPTGSYKDRGAAVMLTMLKQWGVKEIVEDSSGNAGAAIAAYANLAGITANIFIPQYTSVGKAAQISLYGGKLHKTPGSREHTAEAAFAAAEASFYASHNWSPFFIHGVKSYLYEIWEQLDYRLPDYLFVPCGNGSLVLSAALAIQELRTVYPDLTFPKLIAVQATACSPLAQAYNEESYDLPYFSKQSSLAEGILSLKPVRYREILDAVRTSEGFFVTVNEEEIEEAIFLAADKGFFIEPTSATVIAAVMKTDLPKDKLVAVELTGHGLKASEKIIELWEKSRNQS